MSKTKSKKVVAAAAPTPAVLASLGLINSKIKTNDFDNIIFVTTDNAAGTATFAVTAGAFGERRTIKNPTLLKVVRALKTILETEKEATRTSFNATMDASVVAWKSSIQDKYVSKIKSFKGDIAKLDAMEKDILSKIDAAKAKQDSAQADLDAIAHELTDVK